MLVGLLLGIILGVLIMVVADKIHQYSMLIKIDKIIEQDLDKNNKEGITYDYLNDYDIDMHIPRID